MREAIDPAGFNIDDPAETRTRYGMAHSRLDPIYAMPAETAEKTTRRIENYLIEHGLALELEI